MDSLLISCINLINEYVEYFCWFKMIEIDAFYEGEWYEHVVYAVLTNAFVNHFSVSFLLLCNWRSKHRMQYENKRETVYCNI